MCCLHSETHTSLPTPDRARPCLESSGRKRGSFHCVVRHTAVVGHMGSTFSAMVASPSTSLLVRLPDATGLCLSLSPPASRPLVPRSQSFGDQIRSGMLWWHGKHPTHRKNVQRNCFGFPDSQSTRTSIEPGVFHR